MKASLRQIVDLVGFLTRAMSRLGHLVGASLADARGRAQGAPLRGIDSVLAGTGRILVVCGIVLALTPGSSAQDRAVDETITQRSVKVSDAVALALADRAGEAESILATSLRHSPDTALGQLEIASRLVRVAVECAANAKPESADRFADRALELLASARKIATEREAGVVASAWRLEGFIQLDFRGDRAAALAAWREALALAPDDTHARQKVDRLEKELAPAVLRDAEVTP